MMKVLKEKEKEREKKERGKRKKRKEKREEVHLPLFTILIRAILSFSTRHIKSLVSI